MRNLTPKLLCIPLALVLLAGVDPPESPAEDEETDEESQDESQSAEKPPEEQEAGKATAPGQVHTVIKGDTLWDLSQSYLGSPWYWPKVWSYNPEIANPHWIYPGNNVRFYPGGEEGPARVEAGEEEGENLSPDAISTRDNSQVQVVGKIGYHQPKSVRAIRHGFVTPKEVEEAGVISASPAESEMLSFPDKVYVSFRNRDSVKVGGQYAVFRTAGEIKHPLTLKRYGYLTHVVGTIRVLGISKNYATAQINPNHWDQIRRGDLIGPGGEQMVVSVQARKNEREVKAFVIGTLVPFLTLYGENLVVVLDRGSADGVQAGNTFTMVRQQDPIVNVHAFIYPAKGQDPKLPEEDVASCMVIDAKENASLCLITRSLREIVYGDHAVMRVGDSGAPTASLEPQHLLRGRSNR